ncbi:MAG TPA: hypothetical protein VH396_23490 [Chitinophagaceae bacterium]|jgi:hypothetical protein
MENKSNNIKELKDIAPAVANLSNHNLYSVPPGYFDSLADSLLHFIKLNNIRESNPYSVPERYFDTFADSVIHRIKSGSSDEVFHELSEIAPLLTTVNKENVFSVPHNYFEKLSIPVAGKPAAKVISIGSNIRKWVTYAAAASVIFIVAATSYLYVTVHNRNAEPLTIEQRLARLKDQEIINYLKENDEVISGDIIPTSVEQDTEIQDMLQNATDEEIQKYLDEYSGPTEKTVKGI